MRVTDDEMIEIVLMALAGKINKTLVNLLRLRGANAVGISGLDGNLIQAEMKNDKLGFVGNIKKIVATQNITDRYVIVETAVDFNKLNTVLVIKNN